jgi:hypothetical protein
VDKAVDLDILMAAAVLGVVVVAVLAVGQTI